MKKKILITGGTGFIGSNISRYLVNKGHKVTVFDNNFRGKSSRVKDIINKIKYIKGDIRDRELVFKSFKKIDVVIHLAFINGTKFFYEKPVDVLEIATKGIINTIDSCVKNKIKEVYIASSSEVYQTPNRVPTDEKEMLKIPDIHNPRYSYGGGKILAELMGINYGKKYFKKMIIFRPHNVYGYDMGNEHVIPEFIQKISKENSKLMKLKINGTGQEIRSFIHIDDFVDGFGLIFSKGKHMEIYNIGTQNKIKILNLAKLIGKKLNKKIIIKGKNNYGGGTNIRCPNISKIKKLGFKEKISLNNGLNNIMQKMKLIS
jgi:nucleoside-diphosphate-sugar epimerase